VWSVIGQFGGDWHPLVARVSLTGTGVGQLRKIETLDGKEIFERLDAVDNAKRFFRYTSSRDSCFPLHRHARSDAQGQRLRRRLARAISGI
jgi:hypothetical protein